ncbi:membrane-spanning 4-domains subfamily A member 8-like [Pantherophis guttatus]|uniref:Membrane-spanning 4-domains subfamily A member 8-like n=1 Tax=Pantherophis guttatus TaxID=94885 RepID=A0A6P9C8C5_PANGU|nr:membrane-spanning 4-domains subfamily A member 8-like [Pantherophis guttatus]
MASGTTVVAPSNEANIIQMAPGLPSGAPQQVQVKGPLERFFNAEPKVLGAVQILIGLIHIGFGAILLSLFPSYYFSISGFGGYPFLGGILFISSGSLCVAAANRPNRGLVKCSVGMNITSAIMALTGIMLYISEVVVNVSAFDPRIMIGFGCGLSVVLFFFSMLEFCIAVSLAHFGCQATCCSDAQ